MSSDIFNRIAPGWYNFRHWSIFRKELENLAQRWQEGKLINIGCAHGPDFLPFRDNFDLHGVDHSTEMLKNARKYARKFNFPVTLTQADVSYLPFHDETFDWAISVATYHHLNTREKRRAALNELRRVLKPGGEAFITVWNHWQPRFWLHRREVAVPWRIGGDPLQRYYYLFSYPEFERQVRQSGLRVQKSFPESAYHFPIKYFSHNICLLAKKGD